MAQNDREADHRSERESLLEEGENNTDTTETVTEEGSVPVAGFFFIGVVGLLCYNLFLQVMGLLTAQTKNSFATSATGAYGLSNNVGQFICIFLGRYISMGARITISCIMIAVVCIGYPVVINSDIPHGFWTAITLTGLMGIGNAIFQSAGFGLAAATGEKALNFTSLGQSIAGVVIGPGLAIIRGFFSCVKPGNPAEPEISAQTWPVITIFVLVGLVTLFTIPYYYLWFAKAIPALKQSSSTEPGEPARPIGTIIYYTLPLAITVWLVLVGTFLVFPGIVLSWEPTTPRFVEWRPYYSQIMIFVFQVFDAVGKGLAVIGVKLSSFQTKFITPWRLGLLVLFLASEDNLVGLGDDCMRIGLVAILAVTNGLLITWCMILGASQVRKSEAEVAGYTMSFFLVFGISCGAFLAHYLNSTKTILEDLEEGIFEMNALLINDDVQRIVSDVSESTILDMSSLLAERAAAGTVIYTAAAGN